MARRNETSWYTVYTQNPEDVDEQGVYIKAEGEEPPWATETDAEEFDGFTRSKEYEGYIRDEKSAQEFLNYFFGGTNTLVKEVIFL